MPIQLCSDATEATELCERYRLYLKPLWKVKISVQLPTLKYPGKTISSWEVMEKLRNMIKPEQFISLKVSKTNLVLIQFEGEVEKKGSFKKVLQKLQSNSMKLSAFSDILKIRAAAAKLNYPTRHDWDSFFRDAKNIDEMKPGERPDTVYIQDLPSEWFSENTEGKPSEYVLKRVFENFGDIRQVAIASAETNPANQTFGKVSNLHHDLVFDAYVQYKEYISFVKAMDSLKGMKLVHKSDGGKVYSADIKVDFDRTRYLSDKSIHKRTVEQKLIAEKRLSEEPKEQPVPLLPEKSDELEKVQHKKQEKTNKQSISSIKLARKKEAKYLLKALLHKAEIAELGRKAKEQERQVIEERSQQQKLLERAQEEERRKEQEINEKRKYLREQEKLLRERLLKSLKVKEQRRTEELREKLRKEISGRKVLKSVLVVREKRQHSSNRSYGTAKKLKL